MSATDYGSPVFGKWKQAAGESWEAYVDHEFVQGLGDGTLPREAFLKYLVQDYVFLVHFSRAWALAVVKSSSLEEMKVASATVDALVNHEMQLHIETCAKEGISEEELFSAQEEAENLAYTRFVIDAGLSGDFLDLMAALMPCVFGYGVIGMNLKAAAISDTPYKEWIDTYSGEEYQGLCETVATMLENAAAARLGANPQDNPRWEGLCKRFKQACDLEAEFWSMGMRA